MFNSLITIGLPAYKTNFLSNSIDSALNQSYSNFELIILNDNPTSNIKEIVKGFTDERIKYYENSENMGSKNLAACWNKILDLANGDYFCLFSDDDIYHPNFIEELVLLTEKYPDCNTFHSRVEVIDDNGHFKYAVTSSPEYESALNFLWHRIRNYRLFFAPDFMVKTEILKKIGGFVNLPLTWASDELTWYKSANLGGVAATSKVLCYWREGNQNISAIGNSIRKLEAINQYHKLLAEFLDNELKFSSEEQNLYNDVKKNLRTKMITDFGNALKSGFSPTYSSIIQIMLTWVKNRKKYRVPFESLIWALILQIKAIRGSNKS